MSGVAKETMARVLQEDRSNKPPCGGRSDVLIQLLKEGRGARA
jgi:hypothetical protein